MSGYGKKTSVRNLLVIFNGTEVKLPNWPQQSLQVSIQSKVLCANCVIRYNLISARMQHSESFISKNFIAHSVLNLWFREDKQVFEKSLRNSLVLPGP